MPFHAAQLYLSAEPLFLPVPTNSLEAALIVDLALSVPSVLTWRSQAQV
jgi:hypothetical protein